MVIESSCKILITSTKASSFLPSYPSLSNAIATYASASLPNSSVRLRVRVGGRTKRIYAISSTMLSFPFLFLSSHLFQSNPIQSNRNLKVISNLIKLIILIPTINIQHLKQSHLDYQRMLHRNSRTASQNAQNAFYCCCQRSCSCSSRLTSPTPKVFDIVEEVINKLASDDR